MILNNTQEQFDLPSDHEKKQLEYEKLRLENEKLRLEISESKRPWYLKPNHSLYVLIAICTLSVGIVTDRYQAFSSKLDSERALLEQRKNDFAMQRDVVQRELDHKTQQLASANQELTTTKQELVAANQQIQTTKIQKSLQSTEESLLLIGLKNARLFQDSKSTADTKSKVLFKPGAVSEGLRLKMNPAFRDFDDLKPGTSLWSKSSHLKLKPAQETWYESLRRKFGR